MADNYFRILNEFKTRCDYKNACHNNSDYGAPCDAKDFGDSSGRVFSNKNGDVLFGACGEASSRVECFDDKNYSRCAMCGVKVRESDG